MILSTLLAPFGFLLKSEFIDSRIGVGVGGIFGVLGSNYSITGQLPPTSIITVADQMFLSIVAVVIACLIIAVISWRIKISTENLKICRNLDRMGLLLFFAYLAFVAKFLI